jgi:WD40 repeat protein
MTQRTDSMAFSPDGRFLVPTSQYFGPLRAWEVNTGKEERQFDPGPWGCAAFGPDGVTLASGSRTGQLVLWEFATGEKRREWQLPGWIYSVAFAADGRHLVTGNSNGTIYVFRLSPPHSAPGTVPK